MTSFIQYDKDLGEWFIGIVYGAWIETFYGYTTKEQAEGDAPIKLAAARR